MKREKYFGMVLGAGLVFSTLLCQGQMPEPSVPAFSADQLPAKAMTFEQLVANLRDDKWVVRENATMMLLRLDPERLSDVVEAVANEKDMEAELRLIRVAVHLHLKAETPFDGKVGMLGMVFNPELTRLGKNGDLRMTVAAMLLQPGFPVAEVLEPGDRIIAIDGRSFPIDMTTTDFRAIIQSQPVGALLRFTLIRNGKEMEAGVRTSGVPDAALANLDDYVASRNREAAIFVAELKKGVETGGAPMGAAQNP